jgi:hypothetical protein
LAIRGKKRMSNLGKAELGEEEFRKRGIKKLWNLGKSV